MQVTQIITTFTFEVGMKPDFEMPDLATEPIKRYKIEVTDGHDE